MQHYQSLAEVHVQNAWLTIGSFDGVHRGHQTILRRLTHRAHAEGDPAVVLTFHPHPSLVLGKRRQPNYLIAPEERAELLNAMGIDILITHPFNRQVAALSALDFLTGLRAHLGFRQLWVGYDFAMGRNREGNVETLGQLGPSLGFKLHVISPVKVDGEVISSSYIRSLLADGEVEKANRLLGRPYRLGGEVVRGQGRGKTLGIPTANLEVGDQRLIPATGVYVCRARTGDELWGAVANIGVRPTFDDQGAWPTVEAHLLGFEGDLYGRSLDLTFLARVRGEKRFPSPEALVTQIRLDIAQARQLLEAES